MESIQNFFKNIWEKFKAWVEANPRRAMIWGVAILLLIIGFFIPVDSPHVVLHGEPVLSTGPAWFTNSLLTTIIVDIVLIGLALLATSRMRLIPQGFQNVMEALIEYLYGLSSSVAGARARQFFPVVATIFLFVLLCNYTGLVPGVGSIGFYQSPAGTEEHSEEHALVLDSQLAMADGDLVLIQPIANKLASEDGHGPKFVPLFRAPSADLNMTFALAIVTVVLVQYWGVQALGGSYFKKFINTSGQGFMKGVNIFVGILEIISEISRILAFGFRLFGNVFAGEIVLATMAFLVTFFLPIPFYVLELFVGFVQALVFMMLALVFGTMATISHSHDEHEHHHEAVGDHHAAPAAAH